MNFRAESACVVHVFVVLVMAHDVGDEDYDDDQNGGGGGDDDD